MIKISVFWGIFAVNVALVLNAGAVNLFQYNFQSSTTPIVSDLFLDAAESQNGGMADISPASYVDLDGQQIFLNDLTLTTANSNLTWNTSAVTTPLSFFITIYLERVPTNNAVGYVDILESAAELVSFGTPGKGTGVGSITSYIYDNETQVGGGLFSGVGPGSAGIWTNMSPVPEPSTLALAALGALGALASLTRFRRRR